MSDYERTVGKLLEDAEDVVAAVERVTGQEFDRGGYIADLYCHAVGTLDSGFCVVNGVAMWIWQLHHDWPVAGYHRQVQWDELPTWVVSWYDQANMLCCAVLADGYR